MASVLTHAIISSAIEKVDSYAASATGLYDELNGVITNLVSANFNGDAANGYSAFYNEKVVPAITENLTNPGSSLTASIKSMLESIQTQLMDTVDPQLGDNNRNPGAAQ